MPPNNKSFERPSMVPRLLSTDNAKTSLRSSSSSFEADDERSDFGDSMGPEAERHRRVLAEYPGEDTRLTSRKELAGWYMYGWAAEVFVICGMGESCFCLLSLVFLWRSTISNVASHMCC
jgi:UMF1 family MFS transporter